MAGGKAVRASNWHAAHGSPNTHSWAPPWWQLRRAVPRVTHNTRRRLPRLADVPTLVLKPEQDLLVPPKCSDTLAARIPGARLVSFPEAGHGMLQQCRDQVNDVLQEHWTTHGS